MNLRSHSYHKVTVNQQSYKYRLEKLGERGRNNCGRLGGYFIQIAILHWLILLQQCENLPNQENKADGSLRVPQVVRFREILGTIRVGR